MTFLEELKFFGDIRHSGCVLKIDGNQYLMYQDRNITHKHVLSIEATDEKRLIAHWEGFKKSNK